MNQIRAMHTYDWLLFERDNDAIYRVRRQRGLKVMMALVIPANGARVARIVAMLTGVKKARAVKFGVKYEMLLNLRAEGAFFARKQASWRLYEAGARRCDARGLLIACRTLDDADEALLLRLKVERANERTASRL